MFYGEEDCVTSPKSICIFEAKVNEVKNGIVIWSYQKNVLRFSMIIVHPPEEDFLFLWPVCLIKPLQLATSGKYHVAMDESMSRPIHTKLVWAMLFSPRTTLVTRKYKTGQYCSLSFKVWSNLQHVFPRALNRRLVINNDRTQRQIARHSVIKCWNWLAGYDLVKDNVALEQIKCHLSIQNTISLNPFTPKSDFIDFTLSSVRWFYPSKGDPLGVKGLKHYLP